MSHRHVPALMMHAILHVQYHHHHHCNFLQIIIVHDTIETLISDDMESYDDDSNTRSCLDASCQHSSIETTTNSAIIIIDNKNNNKKEQQQRFHNADAEAGLLRRHSDRNGAVASDLLPLEPEVSVLVRLPTEAWDDGTSESPSVDVESTNRSTAWQDRHQMARQEKRYDDEENKHTTVLVSDLIPLDQDIAVLTQTPSQSHVDLEGNRRDNVHNQTGIDANVKLLQPRQHPVHNKLLESTDGKDRYQMKLLLSKDVVTNRNQPEQADLPWVGQLDGQPKDHRFDTVRVRDITDGEKLHDAFKVSCAKLDEGIQVLPFTKHVDSISIITDKPDDQRSLNVISDYSKPAQENAPDLLEGDEHDHEQDLQQPTQIIFSNQAARLVQVVDDSTVVQTDINSLPNAMVVTAEQYKGHIPQATIFPLHPPSQQTNRNRKWAIATLGILVALAGIAIAVSLVVHRNESHSNANTQEASDASSAPLSPRSHVQPSRVSTPATRRPQAGQTPSFSISQGTSAPTFTSTSSFSSNSNTMQPSTLQPSATASVSMSNTLNPFTTAAPSIYAISQPAVNPTQQPLTKLTPHVPSITSTLGISSQHSPSYPHSPMNAGSPKPSIASIIIASQTKTDRPYQSPLATNSSQSTPLAPDRAPTAVQAATSPETFSTPTQSTFRVSAAPSRGPVLLPPFGSFPTSVSSPVIASSLYRTPTAVQGATSQETSSSTTQSSSPSRLSAAPTTAPLASFPASSPVVSASYQTPTTAQEATSPGTSLSPTLFGRRPAGGSSRPSAAPSTTPLHHPSYSTSKPQSTLLTPYQKPTALQGAASPETSLSPAQISSQPAAAPSKPASVQSTAPLLPSFATPGPTESSPSAVSAPYHTPMAAQGEKSISMSPSSTSMSPSQISTHLFGRSNTPVAANRTTHRPSSLHSETTGSLSKPYPTSAPTPKDLTTPTLIGNAKSTAKPTFGVLGFGSPLSAPFLSSPVEASSPPEQIIPTRISVEPTTGSPTATTNLSPTCVSLGSILCPSPNPLPPSPSKPSPAVTTTKPTQSPSVQRITFFTFKPVHFAASTSPPNVNPSNLGVGSPTLPPNDIIQNPGGGGTPTLSPFSTSADSPTSPPYIKPPDLGGGVTPSPTEFSGSASSPTSTPNTKPTDHGGGTTSSPFNFSSLAGSPTPPPYIKPPDLGGGVTPSPTKFSGPASSPTSTPITKPTDHGGGTTSSPFNFSSSAGSPTPPPNIKPLGGTPSPSRFSASTSSPSFTSNRNPSAGNVLTPTERPIANPTSQQLDPTFSPSSPSTFLPTGSVGNFVNSPSATPSYSRHPVVVDSSDEPSLVPSILPSLN